MPLIVTEGWIAERWIESDNFGTTEADAKIGVELEADKKRISNTFMKRRLCIYNSPFLFITLIIKSIS